MTEDSSTIYIDNDLVRRTREGDVSAFEILFERHQKRVYSICLQILSDETDAADATQDVFVRAYKCIHKLNSDAAFVTWLKMMTVNTCRDVLRKRQRSKTSSLNSPLTTDKGDLPDREIEDWSANPEKSFTKKTTCKTIQKAIASLTPEYREVVAMYYVDGAEVVEIAKVLGCPVGTIKSRLARARAKLKRKLAHLVE